MGPAVKKSSTVGENDLGNLGFSHEFQIFLSKISKINP